MKIYLKLDGTGNPVEVEYTEDDDPPVSACAIQMIFLENTNYVPDETTKKLIEEAIVATWNAAIEHFPRRHY